MSWFRSISHLPEKILRHPQHTNATADELQREIEKNREQLQQHRESAGNDETSKMMGKS